MDDDGKGEIYLKGRKDEQREGIYRNFKVSLSPGYRKGFSGRVVMCMSGKKVRKLN